MPEVKKTIEARIEKRIVTDYITCSLCDCKNGRKGYDDTNWGTGVYEIDSTTPLIRKIGSSYPDSGSYESERYDICNNCWDTKLKPWLESQNAEVQKDEVDW